VKLCEENEGTGQWAEQGGVGLPYDNAEAALWYRKAAATLAGVYPQELRCFTVGWGVA
jgi:hypothetical protein